MALTMHWGRDASVDHLLDRVRAVNREVPSRRCAGRSRTWTMRPSETLTRMNALGVGWTMQDAMYFGGDSFAAAARRRCGAPHAARRKRLAASASSPEPAPTRIEWPPTIRSPRCSGCWTAGPSPAPRCAGPAETPSRADALRLYTIGSAWFSFDDGVRGSLEVGKLADLAVLSRDYMTMPVEEIGRLESLLTMVGGRIVYAAGPYVRLNQPAPVAPR